jgi:hypothetical protein
MGYLNDAVYDDGLNVLDTNGTRLDLCYGTEPTTYTEATVTYSCANDTVNCGAPAAGSPSGRGVTIPEITAGSVTSTQDAEWWALTNGTDTLYAVATLEAIQGVTSGNTFTLDPITITLIDAIVV